MAFSIVQSGSTLKAVNADGTLTTLTLPTGVTLDATRKPRFCVFNKYVVLVNSPSRPITIDANGICRVLSPMPPTFPLSLTASSTGALTGAYKALQTFVILDELGNVIAESGFGPEMETAVSTTAQKLTAGQVNISPDQISGSKLYRTSAGGEEYFSWIDVDGNINSSSVIDDLTDESLSTQSAPALGSAPDLIMVAEWRSRLWGVSRSAVDDLRRSEVSQGYAWPAENSDPIPRIGSDRRGITGLAPRREALGIGRTNTIHQVVGNTSRDFRIVKLSENVGIESHESMCIFRDTAFWLWKDGIYRWDQSGIKNISDGKVRSWFTTDDYFDPDEFRNAFAQIDPVRGVYRLFLKDTSDALWWVEYDYNEDKFWGPHKTAAFTPTCAFVLPNASDTEVPLVGSSSGYLWQPHYQGDPHDSLRGTPDTDTGIAFQVVTKKHAQKTPDISKYWGRLSMIGKVQSAGTLTITPKLGGLGASAQSAISHTMSLGRQVLRRIGAPGVHMELTFEHSTAGEPVELYGYEIDDVHELSRR